MKQKPHKHAVLLLKKFNDVNILVDPTQIEMVLGMVKNTNDLDVALSLVDLSPSHKRHCELFKDMIDKHSDSDEACKHVVEIVNIDKKHIKFAEKMLKKYRKAKYIHILLRRDLMSIRSAEEIIKNSLDVQSDVKLLYRGVLIL